MDFNNMLKIELIISTYSHVILIYNYTNEYNNLFSKYL